MPIPLSPHRQHPLSALALHPDVDVRRLLAAELQGIADEVLEHLPQLGGIGHHGGKLGSRDHGPTLPDADLEVREHVVKHRRTIGRLKGLAASAHPRIRQEVLNERMHTGGARDGVGDELMGVGIELVAVALLKQLNAPCDRPQWLLQIMRGDIGELG